MKKLTAAIFVLLFLFQAFYSTAVTYWFYFNRSYIAEKLCINKDKPELKCKGNCYLAKKLKEAESQKKEDTNFQLKEWVSISPFILTTTTIQFCDRSTYNFTFTQKTDDYQYLHLRSIFRPPMAC